MGPIRQRVLNSWMFSVHPLPLQVAIPLHDARGTLAYPDYVDEVQQLVDDINAKFPGAVVMIKQKMSFTDRVALFSNADILVNCAVRHGLSLVPFEFVLARLAGCAS